MNLSNSTLSDIAIFNTCLGLYNSSLNDQQEQNQKELFNRLDKIENDLQEIKALLQKENAGVR